MRRVISLLAAMVSVGLLGTLGTGGGLIRGIQGTEAQAAGRPNIIFILTDDQAQSTLSLMPNVQNLLRGQGRTFTNAFNVYPLCSPSRATIQRGQYAHNHGILGNDPADTGDNAGYPAFDAMDREESTVATWLDAAGYRTIHFGKYMNFFSAKAYGKPPGWDVFALPTVHAQVGETKTATNANRAMTQLREDIPKAAPVFLQVGLQAPHVPNDFESEYASSFAAAQVPRVPSYDEQDVSDKPRYIREDKPPLSQQSNSLVSPPCMDDESNSIEQNDCEYVRQLRALQTVDRFVKNLTDYLASQGELSNTYIVYYTDNGNHWGEHRLDFGKMTPYETDTGFPLLIRGPDIPEGTTSGRIIGNHDIAPTFARMAGANTPSFVDGRSFLRVADDDPTNNVPWRTAIYSEKHRKPDWPLPEKEDSGLYVPPWEAVREENRIYTRHGDDPWTAGDDAGFVELYDLSADPYELRNLVHYGEVPRAELDRLEERLIRLRGCRAEACRAAENDAPPPNATAPRVTSVSPGHTATGVDPSADLTATFSERMDPSSITASTFKLFEVTPSGTTPVTDVSVSADGLGATLDPFGGSATRLARGATYKGVITTGARDEAGNRLDQQSDTAGLQQKAWSFTVGN